jgi:F-type H+-transporting ATPase subunit c
MRSFFMSQVVKIDLTSLCKRRFFVNKLAKFVLLAYVFALFCAPIAVFTQDDSSKPADNVAISESVDNAATHEAANNDATAFTLSTIGAGLVLIGAAYGIGKIGSAAVESMARQPEVAGRIQTAMILAAALVEGAAMFALVICLLK